MTTLPIRARAAKKALVRSKKKEKTSKPALSEQLDRSITDYEEGRAHKLDSKDLKGSVRRLLK